MYKINFVNTIERFTLWYIKTCYQSYSKFLKQK